MSKDNVFKKIDGLICYNFTDKDSNVRQYITYMLNRTQSMFEYENLPDTISQRILELYLQINGNVCFTKVNDKLYVFVGGLGGEPNEYYMPTIYTVANPYLKFSKQLKIGEDCIVVPNDSMYYGLMPMFTKYASQLVENDITMYITDVNMRITSLISAQDDKSFKSASAYLEDVKNGKLGIISESALLESIKSQPYMVNTTNLFSQLIEYHQYTKASWYNELGLNANFNMKRETLNSAESALNDDVLFPLVDDMLKQRELGIKKVNEMFGTNISVRLNSSWKDNKLELEGMLKNVVDNTDGGDDDEKTETSDENE